MNKSLKSKQNGGRFPASAGLPQAMPFSGAGLTPLPDKRATSVTSASSPSPKNQIGFQPTQALDIDPNTALAKTLVTLAGNLGELVFWRNIELSDGQRVIALCFPVTSWTPDKDDGFIFKA